MNDNYRVADYIADFIANIGVQHVFLLPGGGAMHLVDAVGKNSDIEVVACLHEQAAAISAEAYSRINENIGVAMLTTGPGATNAIESFWGYAKTRLVKFKGMDKNMFNLHLKECEFRFNQRGKDMYQILLKLFRDEPLKLS